ncbi:MAG: tRNA pseudouridine(55) synthase TruB [Deltaproteobacteria bacterium]|nr:tRNA pseudouridine(55) synthase TruB [Deltaproteobacteria bacterium]
MNGFLLIDKPAGISSNEALNILKKKIMGKIGHTGTLDPFATGLLVVAVGETSKIIPYLNEEPKVYEAMLKLGEATDTLDKTGRITEKKTHLPIDREAVEKVLKSFVGRQTQMPPMYSAKKKEGKKLYELARQGLEIKRQPQEIEIFELSLQIPPAPMEHSPLCQRGVGGDLISFRVSCSRGTYVRVLGADLAGRLGTVGHLTELRRIQAGSFSVKDAVDPASDFDLEKNLISMESALAHLPSVDLSAVEAKRICQGQPITAADTEKNIVVLKSGSDFLGIGEFRGGKLWPKRLVNSG